MTELLTAAQMRAIEQAAIASGEVTGLDLMERAGRGVVEAIFEEWPELRATSHRAVVLCGPGNNGGDGFVVARLLKDWGWEVEVFLYGDPLKLPPDARVNYERWCERGVIADRKFSDADLWKCELIVDALFGAGLTRPLDGDVAKAVSLLSHNPSEDRRRCSIDVPSGLCLDSGKFLSASSLLAGLSDLDLTVTFQAPKRGHYLADGPTWSGKLVVADIGLPWHTRRKALADLYGVSPPGKPIGTWVSYLLDQIGLEVLSKEPRAGLSEAHKFSHGHALIISGPSGKTGAARLAARGALRIGAGLVSVACEPEALAENAAHLTAIMLRDEPLTHILQDERINALCIGPGLGVDRAPDLIRQAVRAKHTPYVVLDADALTALSRDPDLFALMNERCILTPHAGEFARLFPHIAEKLNAPATTGPAYSKVDATREAARRAGCVVLFKGPDTVIADPSGRASINSAHYERSAPWLATAGSGDVLAGFITGLLARGFAPMQAAETAAWLHVECALSFGPGLIAEDITEELPKVFRKLGI